MLPFEDIIWLFRCGSGTRDLCRLFIEEAAYLYRCIKALTNPRCVEIGRYFGGLTTLLLAAGGKVVSIDNHSKSKACAGHDRKLINWARDNDMAENLSVVVADSKTYPAFEHDVLIIDGDHSYEGVQADYNNWAKHTKESIFFHDVHPAQAGIEQFVEENDFNIVNKVTSLLHVAVK